MIVTGLLMIFFHFVFFIFAFFFFSSRRRHTRSDRDWSSDVCSSDLARALCGRVQGLALWSAARHRRFLSFFLFPPRPATSKGKRESDEASSLSLFQIGRAHV